ncbi:2'-5' RNA ligase family protein [Collimonas sp.]|jgi:2'-5' RNA ligase|uniref:2'-5' RNA ligase family protein n=1 Tax=Collimonas sp. TaxID=1963772 RepID=UPI002BE83C10|nr:2'-5' RNA ligase family protein [Collimonas sp.]HWX00118.1 2'-5' RNA ligase family protein [Collimonas sp.]
MSTRKTSLPGFDSSQKPTDRLLFAVMPEKPAVARIEQLTRALCLEHDLRGAAVHAEQLHITLVILGEYLGLPPDLLAAAAGAASQIAQTAFRVRFDYVQTFRNKSRVTGNYPIVLCGDEGVVGLETLHQGLSTRLRNLGFKGISTSMTPHVTLLYEPEPVPGQAVAAVEWTVGEFVLLQRHIDQRRPYSILGSWPLQKVSWPLQ